MQWQSLRDGQVLLDSSVIINPDPDRVDGPPPATGVYSLHCPRSAHNLVNLDEADVEYDVEDEDDPDFKHFLEFQNQPATMAELQSIPSLQTCLKEHASGPPDRPSSDSLWDHAEELFILFRFEEEREEALERFERHWRTDPEAALDWAVRGSFPSFSVTSMRVTKGSMIAKEDMGLNGRGAADLVPVVMSVRVRACVWA